MDLSLSFGSVTILLKAIPRGTRNPMKGAKSGFSGGMAHRMDVSD